MLTSKATWAGDWSKSKEGVCVLVLCAFAAIRVFVYSAAFPFFVLVDEEAHLDTVLKYSHGQMPRGLTGFSEESLSLIIGYRTWEYLLGPEQLPKDGLPPLWAVPTEKAQARVASHLTAWRTARNHEELNPPLYYVLAGVWVNAGRLAGMANGFLLYWVRFLNVLLAASLVWLTYAAARLLFPDRIFLRIGAPLLMSVLPQDTFYSIQSDVLSPLCYAAAFICLVRWCRDEQPSSGLSAKTGLSLAATGLVKTSNLPLLVVAVAAILLRVTTLGRFGKLRSALPGLGVLGVCAAGPLAGWCLWCLHVSGDLTGSTAKIRALGWTWKTAADWWSHPIFTPHGAWVFWSGMMATFWRGEFTWHGFGHPLASPLADVFYSVFSLFLCGLAAGCLVRYDRRGNPRLYRELGLGLAGFVAGVGFLAFLSVVFDFGNCPFPSRTYPYMTSGRLISGSLVPFLLLYVYGLDYAFRWCKSEWARWFGLGLSAAVAIASEVFVSLPVFSSQYNWYHF